MKIILLTLFIIITIAAHAENEFQPLYQADLPRKATKISYDQSGKIIELVTSEWNDRVKTDKGLIYYSYNQGFNYKRKQGFLKVYNSEGKLIHEKWDKSIDGGVSAEEVLTAFDLVKNNEFIKKRFASTDESIMLYGGFNFRDEKECKPGNRCVRVFATTLNRTVLSHSIVRLTDSKVVYPNMGKERSDRKIPKLAKKTKIRG